MNNYANGLIYKITSQQTPKIYIGSTCLNINIRFALHLSQYRRYNQGNGNYCSSYEILEYNDATISIVENYPCNSSSQLREREKYWQVYYKDIIVNKRKSTNIEYITKEQYENEWKSQNRDLIKKYQYFHNHRTTKCEICYNTLNNNAYYKHIKTIKHDVNLNNYLLNNLTELII